MFFLGGNFVSSIICTLKSKKPKKPLIKPKKLKTFSKKPSFFPALAYTGWSKKAEPQFYFCDNFRKCTPILMIVSLLEQEICDA